MCTLSACLRCVVNNVLNNKHGSGFCTVVYLKMHVNSDSKQFLISLQCPYKQYLPQPDRAWHILTHWIQKTEDELQTYLQNYILQRKDWFLSISKSYLANLQVSAEDYIDSIRQPGSHIDLLGLFVLSGLYEFHFRLFYDQGVWCTARNKDFKQTSMMLIFRGETSFGETFLAIHRITLIH